MNGGKTRNGASRVIMIIALLFLIPIVLAGLFYKHKTWLPEKKLNHGKLITPPLSLHELNLDPAALQHRWGLIYVHNGACDSLCRQDLYNIQQIQRALGKDMNRIQRIMLTTVPPDQPTQDLLNASHTTVWQADPAVVARVLGQQPADFYISDPLGNIMLKYSEQNNPEWMLDDLKYLLNASGIG